jgi:tetratricopeptide (TPR) repeat protein
LKWATTATYAANWHPVTWVSHMMDCSVYGLFAGGHHLTNVLLHTLNTLLLFLLLDSLTGALWPAAMAAALFGWHPLHVESVAWIAERKDLLSTLFLLSTLWAYARYAKNLKSPTSDFKFHYAAALFFFALALMSKPMVVTLPFLLLLLDYWPLRRTAGSRLLLEKVPFFALSIAACAITLAAQHSGGAMKTLHDVPLGLRSMNAAAACGWYLYKTVFPASLCVFYPLPVSAPLREGLCSVLVLVVISGLAFLRRAKYPWLAFGWLWFLGTLVPVIGIVQVGGQAVADRYTYIPLIGIFIALAWSLNQWLAAHAPTRTLAIGAVSAWLALCIVLTHEQLQFWKNGITLYTRILAVTPEGAMAEDGLGVALSNAGRGPEAIPHYEEALRLKPDSVHAHYNVGIEYAAAGDLDHAAYHFSEALKLNPRSELLHNNLGTVLARQNKTEAALTEFRRASELNPSYPAPYLNSGMAFEQLGRIGEAADNYAHALKLDPSDTAVLNKLAHLLATCRGTPWFDPAHALELATRANQLTQFGVSSYLETMSIAEAATGDYTNALSTGKLALQKAQANGLQEAAQRIQSEVQAYNQVGRDGRSSR